VRPLPNEKKQYATVYSEYLPIDGIRVCVSPPGDDDHAIIAAHKRATSSGIAKIELSVFDNDERLTIDWGKIVPTRAYLHSLRRPACRKTKKEEERELRIEIREMQSRGNMLLQECPLCFMRCTLEDEKCLECHYQFGYH